MSAPEQPVDHQPDAPERGMFEGPTEEEEGAAQRLARKRAAIWGFGMGLAMAIVLALCVLLFFWAVPAK